CFDKVARMLNLPYPGGPEIEKLAKTGNPNTYPFKTPRVKTSPYHFSFSGLKTKVLYTVYGQNGKNSTPIIPKENYKDVAASFQKAAFASLLFATKKACEELDVKSFLIGGGVSCNLALKELFEKELPKSTTPYFPKKNLTLDNAAMIAALGHYQFLKDGASADDLTASPTSKKAFTSI
ncbi:tRNA (adenosine(37)-N6)-threonylcarbamoyltransferase complex transferase subunit TsaD, partial [bacterium]|nr:tRNA (adenosine(37)-N6)-threonylcarbamoyltransferase complex transferase subunit TsaD [bacterium]